MQLNNVKKKIEKAGAKIGIAGDETVLAACTTNPSGTMKRMLAKELGGVLGAIAADRGGEAPPEGEGQADRFPTGQQQYVVVTDTRLLVFSVATMSGKPKELKAEWPVAEVAGITTEPGKLAIPLSIAFADGSAVQVEAAKGTGGDTLAQAIDTIGVRATG